ncbi:unnamed protein product, partial [Larinioides sclopetarius]
MATHASQTENGSYAMGGYEVTDDSEQPMMFKVCLSAVKADQSLPPKRSHVGVFDVTCIRTKEENQEAYRLKNWKAWKR